MSTDHGGETAGDKTGTAGTADKAGGRTDAGATGAVDAGALFGVTVNCDDAVHELYHYLDGELTEERREEIRVHLDWCGPCSGAADFEGELRKVIANKCKDRVPRTLIDRVAAAIDEESRQHDGGH
jgi:mycothiol system anti-sigma-R factor